MSLNFYLVEMFPPFTNQIFEKAEYGIEKISVVSEDFMSDIDTMRLLDKSVSMLVEKHPECAILTKLNPAFFPGKPIEDNEDVIDVFLDDHIQFIETRTEVLNTMTNELAMIARICAHPSGVFQMEGHSEFFAVH